MTLNLTSALLICNKKKTVSFRWVLKIVRLSSFENSVDHFLRVSYKKGLFVQLYILAFMLYNFLCSGKGKLISKCPFGVIIWTKIPTKFFPEFLP